MPRILLSRRQKFAAFIGLLIICLFLLALPRQYQIRNTLSYLTRPIWDTYNGPDVVLPHFYADGIEFNGAICRAHNWTRSPEPLAPVFDAVLFSTELDLLELRWNELDPVVDKFFLLESKSTFTGLPKDAVFSLHKDEPRFARFSNKTVHILLGAPAPGTPPFEYEAEHRREMTRQLNAHGAMPGTLVLMADVDEIPSAHTVQLLRSCSGWGPRLHLGLRNFLYSFEWELVDISWRAAVEEWGPNSWYGHSKHEGTTFALADSGWHCSFCFRTIKEFVTKMTGFSHADRIGGNLRLLNPERIQKTICSGSDPFDMLPEAYTWKDMLALMNPEPKKSAVGLPKYLIENWERMRFLLPGGCIRGE